MEYQVIHEFLSCTHEGKDIMQRMVIVQDERGVCVTSEEEWRKIWGVSIRNGGKINRSVNSDDRIK